jgi:hypothetical protein
MSGGAANPEHPSALDAFESRLVWILGSPRTGSTWLLRLLIHPWRISADGRTGMRRPRLGKASLRRWRAPDVVAVNESYLPAHLTPITSPGPERGRQPSTREFLLHSRRAADPSYFFSDQFAEVWRAETRRMALARFRAQADAAAREHALHDPLVVIKEPNGSHGAELLMSLFPRARLIFLIRDGRDVLDSLMDAHRRGGWLGGQGGFDPADRERRLQFVRTHARHWVNAMNAVQSAFDAHPPELRRRVVYEEMRSDPNAVVRPLDDWLGLGRGDRELEQAISDCAFESIPRIKRGPGRDRRAARPGLWRENFTAEEQKIAAEIMGEKLEELGYPVSAGAAEAP